MASADRALKRSSLKPEMEAQHALCDDFLATYVQTAVPYSVDEFFVDDLLDFSNGGMDQDEEDDDDDNKGLVVSVFPQEEEEEEERTSDLHCKDVTCSSLLPIELSVPADDLADLEWLSNFVEDSFTDNHPSQNLPHKCTVSSEKPPPRSENFPKSKAVPAKARSKRSRAGCHAWSSHSLSGESSSSPTSSTSSSPTSTWVVKLESLDPAPPVARRKRVKATDDTAAVRRCTHCGVQKTPQWRTGPVGAKTLCNACGVRFKSGRLLPEYRPACSPSFSTELHSNSHRKVLEMRRGKEEEPERVLAVQKF